MALPTKTWKKRILLPFWLVRICLMIVVIVGFAVSVGLIKQLQETENWDINMGAAIAFLLLAAAVLVLDVLQMTLFFRGALGPASFLGMNALQTSFWAAVLAMDVYETATKRQDARALGLGAVMFLLYFALFVYAARACVAHRRDAKRGLYAPALNPAAPIPMDTPYAGAWYGRHVRIASASTEYVSPARGPGNLYPSHGGGPPDWDGERPMQPATLV